MFRCHLLFTLSITLSLHLSFSLSFLLTVSALQRRFLTLFSFLPYFLVCGNHCCVWERVEMRWQWQCDFKKGTCALLSKISNWLNVKHLLATKCQIKLSWTHNMMSIKNKRVAFLSKAYFQISLNPNSSLFSHSSLVSGGWSNLV